MDDQKKRKRTESGGDRRRHGREGALKENNAVSPPPSEAEVDEFFAILRRMNVAVKYLQKNTRIDDLPGCRKRVSLDLNTLPENGD